LIKGGEVINPRFKTKIALDILIKNGKIEKILSPGSLSINYSNNAEVIDASGMIITPGLIDMHVHFREPGDEHKETILTGSEAAAAGGYTAVACMPNTKPVNDSKSVTEYIIERAKKANLIRIYPIAAISKGQRGESLTEFGELQRAGAVALSDDGRPVYNSKIMRDALEQARNLKMPIISHCEDLELSKDGVIHEGAVSAKLGLKGIPSASEEIMVIRDILLSKLTKCPVHIAHVSTEGSVKFIEQAKEEGVSVTAETAPHYFSLDHRAVVEFGANAKMYPPLREPRDMEAIKKGLSKGVIDVIATDHAPHSHREKGVDIRKAPPGIIGLQTALSLTLSLVREGVMDMITAIAKLSWNPANILGINGGIIEEGGDADLTIIDLNKEYKVDRKDIKSKSHNSPFIGRLMKGKAVLTMVRGRVAWRDSREDDI
jgi:dihydroorotase